jgi:hypothetical protein
MKKEFALDPDGPKRLTVTYPANLKNAEVLFDGKQILTFSTKADLERGTTCKLPDGSMLTVRFGPIEGLPLLKGIHVIRNGAPVPGSAADPVPKWAWIFMIACALIPVVTLGGGLPALIGFAGVGGILAISRLNRWTVALRAGVCALITVACWSGLILLFSVVVAVKAVNQAKQPFGGTSHATSSPAMSPTDKYIHDIGVAYYNHRYKQKDIEVIKDRLYDECDQMQPAQCTDHLQKALQEARNTPDLP